MSIGTQISRNAIEKLMLDARIQGKQIELSDAREPGLRIRAGQRAATWLLNCRLQNGKRTRIKLGQWPGMGIQDARHEAQRKRAEILDGTDPNEQRRIAAIELERQARNRRTVSSVLDEYHDRHLSTLKRGEATRRALDGPRGLLHDLRNSDIGSLNVTDISQALRESHKRAPIAANRNLAYARAFFNWCKSEQIISDNPAADIRKPARERSRDRVHTVSELKEIWNAAASLGYPFSNLVRLLIVIPMRREEIASIRLSELQFDGKMAFVWTLPADRTKTGNALRVPLPKLAAVLLDETIAAEERPADSDFVFTTTGDTSVSGFSKAKARLDQLIHDTRLGEGTKNASLMPHWTLHDLRTTFCTLACDELGADMNVVDRMLNHVASSTTSKIKRVYNRSEMFEARREVANDWAEYLEYEVIDSRQEVCIESELSEEVEAGGQRTFEF